MKLKLKTRIIGGMFCIFLLVVVLGTFNIITINDVQEKSWELDVLIALDASINEVLEDLHIWRYELVSAVVFAGDFTNSLDADSSAYGIWRASPNSTWIYDEQLHDLIVRLDSLNREKHDVTRVLIEGQRAGTINMAFLRIDLESIVLPLADESIAHLQSLSARYRELVNRQSDEVWRTQTNAQTIIIIIGVVAVIMFGVISYFVTNAILNPVKHITTAVSEVAAGKLNVNLTYDIDDEIGMLTRDVHGLVGTIQTIVQDLTQVNREYNEVGNIEFKIDTGKYQNSFKDVVESVNSLLDNQTNDVQGIISVLEHIVDGDFEAKIADMPGMKNEIPQTLRAVISALKELYESAAYLAKSAADGKLDVSVDAAKFKGSWADLAQALNRLVASVEAPISETRDIVAALNRGEFDKLMRGSYSGDFLSIKNDVNQLVTDLASYVNEIAVCLSAVDSGDLTRTITMDFDGDFNKIRQSVNQIVATLNKTMSEISSASSQVLTGAQQISSSATDLANGATEQASSVEEINATIDTIIEQTGRNAENAEQASTLSGKSTENAREGNKDMQQMLSAMEQIKDSSSAISRIIKTIQDIAFQTNLLALNAAVEAARAGEHGRGFSVVAEEVRSLASRSQAAATETTGLIQDSIDRVDSGSSIAESTAEALDVIVNNANDVMEIIENISTSSKEQAVAIGQLGVGLEQISNVVQSNSAVSEETAAAAEELNSQAEVLRDLVSYFKV